MLFFHFLFHFTQIVFLSKKSMKSLMKIKKCSSPWQIQLSIFNSHIACHISSMATLSFRGLILLFLFQAYCPLSPSFLFQPLMLLCSEIHSLASLLSFLSLFILPWEISSSPITLNPILG